MSAASSVKDRSMKPSYSLSIPTPCSEDWNSFTPTSTGGFCGSCKKNVIDFTKATDDEIIAFISRKPQHVCGSFTEKQLKIYEFVPATAVRPGFPLLKAGALSLLLFFISRNASAQAVSEKPAAGIVQQPLVKKSDQPAAVQEIVIRGMVRAASDSIEITGASVVVKGTSIGVQTDAGGNFELRFTSRKRPIIFFAFIGYKTQEVVLDENQSFYDLAINLEEETVTLGEAHIVIRGELGPSEIYQQPKSEKKKFWNKIKNLF